MIRRSIIYSALVVVLAVAVSRYFSVGVGIVAFVAGAAILWKRCLRRDGPIG